MMNNFIGNFLSITMCKCIFNVPKYESEIRGKFRRKINF